MTTFAKGHPKHGGRKKGVPNHVTADAKKLMSELVDYGLVNGKKWLARTARQNPARALEALAKLAEYKLPKLAKTDVDVHGGVQVLERRYYGEAPRIEGLKANQMAALPEAVDADVEELL